MPLLFPVGLMAGTVVTGGGTGGGSVTTPSLGASGTDFNTTDSLTVAGGVLSFPGLISPATGDVLVRVTARRVNPVFVSWSPVTLGGVSAALAVADYGGGSGNAMVWVGFFRGVAHGTAATLSLTPTGTTTGAYGNVAVSAQDVSNLPSSGYLGATTVSRHDSVSANSIACTLSPQASGSLLVGAVGLTNVTAGPASVGSGWIKDDDVATGPSSTTDVLMATFHMSSATAGTGAVTQTTTTGGSSNQWAAALVELKGA